MCWPLAGRFKSADLQSLPFPGERLMLLGQVIFSLPVEIGGSAPADGNM
jgi:hypothetical protein